jgi:hypothetical protein
MLDRILMFAVVTGPTLFAVAVEAMSEGVRKHWFWRYGVMIFGLLLSGLTWWQISRAEESASIAQEAAIERVTTETSERVTKVVSEQYQKVVTSLTDQIGALKGQLSEQGKKVDVISNSNIVTGKSPIKVEVTNPSSYVEGENTQPPPHVAHVVLNWQKQESVNSDTPYCQNVILQSDMPINPVGFLVSFSARIKSVTPVAIKVAYQGAFKIEEQDPTTLEIAARGIGDELLKPETPLVVLVCSDKDFKPTKLVRAVVE